MAKAKNIRIRMLKLAAGPTGNFEIGQEYIVTEKLAQQFAKGEAAVVLGDADDDDDAGDSGGSEDQKK